MLHGKPEITAGMRTRPPTAFIPSIVLSLHRDAWAHTPIPCQHGRLCVIPIQDGMTAGIGPPVKGDGAHGRGVPRGGGAIVRPLLPPTFFAASSSSRTDCGTACTEEVLLWDSFLHGCGGHGTTSSRKVRIVRTSGRCGEERQW